MRGYTRRSLLVLGGAAAAGAVVPVAAGGLWGDAFAVLRRRWTALTTDPVSGQATLPPYRERLAELGREAARLRDTMAPGPTSLWPGMPYPSFNATPARLRSMARAYVLPGTGLTGDAGLASAVAAGLDHYRRHVYAAGAEARGNWWNWQIGVPKALLDAAVLVAPHLTSRQADGLRDAVDHFVPPRRLYDYSGNSTGANRVDLCTVMLLRAVLGADPDRAALAASALSPVLRYVEEGDGFYRDGSFIQHTYVPYQGGYGLVALAGLAALFAVLRGTPWEIPEHERRVLHDSVDGSFAPVIHDGFCMDLAGGRGVGRRPYGDHRRGRMIAASILLLAETAPAADRERWRAMVKGWAARDTARPMLGTAEAEGDLGFHARLAAVTADERIPAAPEPAGHRLLPMSARAVHRAPGWCAGLSMASYRVGHYEHGNGENLRGWHTGSGMLYWWAEGHGDQYSDSFWATVDPYRLPGTTVSTKRLPDGAGAGWGDTCPPGRWVGGASDGAYAAVGQHLNGLDSTMEAFKSWFFLDDAVLCLGAGIRSEDGVPVETVVDNRRTGAPLTVDGTRVAADDLPEGTGVARWAHLDGHGGYVLPGGGPLRVLRERRAGAGGAEAAGAVARDYVTLWLDHGADPRDAAYVYLLLPGATQERTRARAADPGWARVLANTSRAQGVHVPSLGLTGVNFWHPGTAGPLTASAPCAVLLRELPDGTATLTVADPRCDLDELTVTWRRPVTALVEGHPLLTRATTGPALTARFDGLAGHLGASCTITLSTASA
ncbi:polysaccharide lyase 8 family protein [Nonomuraea sp. 3-1Str]|uniref:polysaccharide lyase 8 family protein n=1 Tax=Nonomuraea sp. 3-1Str TaxID=2929801 RepID=UPI00285F3128|nr:polysaccharide lyase 8 family protein [Nonomuraea sp. 3-1Str]MDR8409888.1 polysaccharide lyase 8 family protein [Nonomuraea sp. 3-1Str]